ncbi:MAG: hypothetical protein AB7P41_14260 [Dehalococcoidia bacterium]
MHQIRTRTIGLAGLIILVVTLALASGSWAGATRQNGAPTPVGFDRYLVYMANGVFDPDAEPALLPGEIFHREIMGRSPDEMAEQEALAREFFQQRFGLNLEDGSVIVESFTFNPVHNYRAYTIAGESVPAEGWIVRDGGFRAEVVAEDGVTLGGEFAGTHVPQGTSVVFGDYNILVTSPGRSGEARGEREIVLHYRSSDPLIPDQFGVMHFTCGLVDSETDLGVTEDDWDGIAQGVVRPPESLPDGTVKVSIRNVLTFPPR